jgi:general secretion pathway protein F
VPAQTALADFIVLNEEIAALVRARLPIESQLARLGRELPGKAGPLAERIGQRMERGESLSSAMDAECASLPAAYRATVVAGIQSGQLGAALESLVDSATRLDQLRRVTGVAILYPLFVAVTACVLMALVVSQVLPSFEWLNMRHFGALRWLSNSPLTVPLLGLAVPAAVMLGAVCWWWRSGLVGATRSNGLGRLSWMPGARRIQRWSQATTFAELMLLMVERGIPLDRALTLAAGATNDSRLRAAGTKLADEIRQGVAIHPAGSGTIRSALAEFPLLIRLALYRAGDRALLAGGLQQAAAMYRERTIRAAEWYAEYLPILLTVFIGGTLTIGFALAVLGPYARALHELAGWNWR